MAFYKKTTNRYMYIIFLSICYQMTFKEACYKLVNKKQNAIKKIKNEAEKIYLFDKKMFDTIELKNTFINDFFSNIKGLWDGHKFYFYFQKEDIINFQKIELIFHINNKLLNRKNSLIHKLLKNINVNEEELNFSTFKFSDIFDKNGNIRTNDDILKKVSFKVLNNKHYASILKYDSLFAHKIYNKIEDSIKKYLL